MEESGKIVQVLRAATSVNPNPRDEVADLVLAQNVVARLLDEVGAEAKDNLRDFAAAMERILKSE